MDSRNLSGPDELSPEKRELLAYLLEEEGIASPPTQAIPRRENSDELPPLSFAQQWMWLLNQLQPDSAAYNEPTAVRLTGSLNVTVLEQSLNEIVRRHDILRTTITTVEGEPVQAIQETIPLTLPVVDLQALSENEQEVQIQKLATEEFQQRFDLAQGPLLRVKLLRLAEEEHVFLLTMHHIVSDGWSLGVLFGELAALYRAFSSEKPSPLPELPIQYADFAQWQRQWLHSEVLEKDLAYWKQQLGGGLPRLELPTDRPRLPVQTTRGARHYLSLPMSLSEALKTLSYQEGVTLFMTLLAAFRTLLHRYTGQDDILVGTPIAGRSWPEVEGLLGCFLNTLVLRTELSGSPSFRELLGQVHEVALEAYAHQDLPFEQLVEKLQPERDLSCNPLFQVMFVLQNPLTLELPDLSLRPLQLDRGATPLDLVLSLEETTQGLVGWWEYNTDLFDFTTIARMAGHLQTLLEGIVDNPDQQLSNLPLLTKAERYQLLVEWNDTRANYPKDSCIHQLFEAQVERLPDAPAVVFEDEHLTYRELNTRANQLAHHLRALGVGPDALVGICVERSLEMVVGLLGVLKAGGAFVPLDPAYPKERLAFMLEDAQVSVLLTQQRLLAELPEHGAYAMCLDSAWDIFPQESNENPTSGVMANNLAYVIYTSGSTGRPKGVLVEHGGLCNMAEAQIRTFDLRPENRILQFSSLSFDASIFEIVMALRVGATLCLGTQESLLPGPALMRLLRDQAVTNITIPPSALHALPDEELPLLRTIKVAGEACSADLVARWAPNRRFFNLYGPTETTIWATFAQCIDGGDGFPV